MSRKCCPASGRLIIASVGLALVGSLTLSACSGGGDIDIGSGQAPDPATVDFPIAYVKRSLPEPQDDDLRDMRTFRVDADAFVRQRADASVPERNITDRVTSDDMWDIRDLEVSYDGTRMLLAMRGPMIENADEEDQPTWNIWEYEFATDTLRRVITSDIIAEEGHDVAPHYLPDGRIVFSSTRQRQAKAILLDEGKPQFDAQTEDRREPAFTLHVMNADGSGIRQISFSQSHDLDPIVLRNGRILFTRWDTAPGRSGMHLYTMNPDGTDLQLHYGAVSHQTGSNQDEIQFVRTREMPDGRLISLIRAFDDADFGGDLQFIDAASFVENGQPLAANAGLQGPAQTRATGNDVRTIPGISPGGRFSAVFPLWDGTPRIAVSWTQCRAQINGQVRPCTSDVLADPNVQPAPSQYSIWMYDLQRRAFLPLMTPEPDRMITDVVIAQPRTAPVVILDKVPGVNVDAEFVGEGVGVIDVRSVYDVMGRDTSTAGIATLANPMLTTADQRPARFIRIEKAVSIPDDDTLDFRNTAFGTVNFMREILGYGMVEPDGSVRLKVPANVAFQISILDRDGRRISPLHRNWLQLRPGEVLTCNGCHVREAQLPRSHGRAGSFNAAWQGASAGAFPGATPTLAPQPGETMAQTRARLSCQLSGPDRCRSMQPSVDVSFEDVWTDPVASGRPADASFAYRYGELTTPVPVDAACLTRWTSNCRITIHYERHIHPLWSVPRVTLAADNVTVLADNTCVRCHSPTDPANNNAVRVPAGQLDLSDGPSEDQPDHFKSYRELLFTDNAQEVNMGALRDILVTTGVDPVTNLPIQVTVPVPPSMAAGNARGSTRFFSRFAAGGSHAGYLTTAELRLLSEWLDIGAQYYNNPFAAPLN